VTERMREALLEARKGPLRRVHDGTEGKPPWPANPCSLAALVKHGLLDRSERKSKSGNRLDEWTITDEGRSALNPPAVVKRDVVRSLRAPGGSTRMMQLGYWVEARTPEPEPVDPDEVDAAWFGAAARRHADAMDRREAARRVRRAA
jgi:DNA-binding PadR family transcriptional regulator